jgi:tRNA A58 N-methylase Trm61
VFALANLGDTVVQVGIRSADIVHRYSRVVGPKGRVIFFEPAPSKVEMARAAMKSAPFPNSILVPKGAWSRRGMRRIAGRIGAEVPVETVDDVLEAFQIDRVDYMSIHVSIMEALRENGFRAYTTARTTPGSAGGAVYAFRA